MLLSRLSLLAIWAASLAAQTFPLGTPTDPCTGGTAYTITATNASLRYGDFTCTFPVTTQPGFYAVRLEMQEPCIGACSPPITTSGQRVQNVYVNESQVLTALDPFRAGSQSINSPVARTVLAWIDGSLTVRVQTVIRAGVLSRVIVSDGLVRVARQQCVGQIAKPGEIDTCSGIELWTVNTPNGTLQFAVVQATPQLIALPACTAQITAGCLRDAGVGDPILKADLIVQYAVAVFP